jgi:hypothetical protein
MLPFTVCDLWFLSYTMHLQLRILRLQYSSERICAAIADISKILRALYCNPGAKCSAHPPVYAMWTVVPYIYNVITAPHFQAPILNWTNLHCYWRYLDNSKHVILQTWCQKLRTTSSLRRANCGPSHIQCNCSSAYVGFNIRPKVSAVLLDITGHIDARYTANLVANIAQDLPFTLCELCSRTYTISITAPHIHSSIFNWTNLRYCLRYFDNSISFILQTCC